MLEAKKGFRSLKAYNQLPLLRAAFHDRDHGLIAARAIKRTFTGRIWLDASEHHPDGI
jgi:hypothetical protein